MRLTWKDAAGTAFTAASIGAWAAYVGDAGLAGLSGPRSTAVVMLALGIGACATGNSPDVAEDKRVMATGATLGGISILFAVLAVVTGSDLMLTGLAAATVTLWVLTTMGHAVGRGHGAKTV